MSIAAYKKTIRHNDDPRDIERRVLSAAAAAIQNYAEAFDAAVAGEKSLDSFRILAGGLRDALWENQRIWMAFANALSHSDNGLPADLRADLISLAIWVDKQTAGALGGDKTVTPLVELNQNIIAGLSANAPAAPVNQQAGL